MWRFCLITLLCCSLTCAVSAGDFRVDVEHNLGNDFVKAGEITGFFTKQGKPFGRFRFERDALDDLGEAKFKQLVAEKRLYQIRIKSQPEDSNSQYVLGSIPAKCLAHAGYREILGLHMEGESQIVALEYRLPKGVPCTLDRPEGKNLDVNFKSKADVIVHKAQLAPELRVEQARDVNLPPEYARQQQQQQPISSEDDSDDKQPKKDERTWFQKNWLFVLGAVMLIMNLVSSGGPDQPEGGGREPPRRRAAQR